MGKEYVKQVVQVYLDVFGCDWKSWINELVESIPLQLLVIGEELGGNCEQKWSAFLKEVQMRIRERIRRDKFLLEKVSSPQYNRECEWFRLFWEDTELRDKVPSDFKERTRVHLTWQCSLLRVWIGILREEESMRQTDYASFFPSAANSMKDGEKIIAVELESLEAVKRTAWPPFINWRNEEKTPLQISLEKWGTNHDITEFLQMQTKQLVRSRFLIL